MRIGLGFDLREPDADRVGWGPVHARTLEVAEEADRCGIDALWLTEHHFFADGYLPQPLVFAAALAARTRTARIGTAVMLAPLRDPITIAEEAAVVDAISGGRLELGFGAGYRIPEFAAFGADIKDRFGLLERRVGEVRDLWRGDVVTPRPVQADPPMWVGGHGPRAARIAARTGAGLLSVSPRAWEPYLEAVLAGGGTAADARAGGPLSWILADDPERTWAIVRPYAERHWQVYDWYAREGRDETSGTTLPKVFDVIEGTGKPPVDVITVDDAIERLRALNAKVPLDHVFLWERVAGMPDDVTQRHVELVTDALAPAARALAPADAGAA